MTVENRAVTSAAKAALSGVTPHVIKKGEPVPDRSALPVEGMPAYPKTLKPIEEQQTIEDKLVFIEDALQARKELGINELGQRYIVLILPDKTRIGGAGDSTSEAFNNLLARLQQFNLLEG